MLAACTFCFRRFLIFYVPCLLVQLIGGYFTQLSVTTWYQTLDKSALTPPGIAFGIAWTILYFLMAVAATRIHLKRKTFRSRSLVWWAIQLLLGLIWCIVFFGNREIALGFAVILANLVAVAVTLYRFYRIDTVAAWLMAPLLAWLMFASYLNGFILYKL